MYECDIRWIKCEILKRIWMLIWNEAKGTNTRDGGESKWTHAWQLTQVCRREQVLFSRFVPAISVQTVERRCHWVVHHCMIPFKFLFQVRNIGMHAGLRHGKGFSLNAFIFQAYDLYRTLLSWFNCDIVYYEAWGNEKVCSQFRSQHSFG